MREERENPAVDENDQLMTRFLLRDLPDEDHVRVAERLAADDAFFQEMASFEDDLIVRFHRGLLGPEQQQAFERVYRESPERWARVTEWQDLVDAAHAWKLREDEHAWNGIGRWLVTPWRAPRLVLVAAGAAVVAAATVVTYLVGQQPGAAGRYVVVAFTLTAVGERGPGPARTMDRLRIPADADEVQLAVEVPDSGGNGRLEIEIEPVDGGVVVQPAEPRVERSGAGIVVTASLAAGALPDGDYILRVLRRAGSAQTETVAIRAFRVARTKST